MDEILKFISDNAIVPTSFTVIVSFALLFIKMVVDYTGHTDVENRLMTSREKLLFPLGLISLYSILLTTLIMLITPSDNELEIKNSAERTETTLEELSIFNFDFSIWVSVFFFISLTLSSIVILLLLIDRFVGLKVRFIIDNDWEIIRANHKREIVLKRKKEFKVIASSEIYNKIIIREYKKKKFIYLYNCCKGYQAFIIILHIILSVIVGFIATSTPYEVLNNSLWFVFTLLTSAWVLYFINIIFIESPGDIEGESKYEGNGKCIKKLKLKLKPISNGICKRKDLKRESLIDDNLPKETNTVEQNESIDDQGSKK